MIRDSFWTMEYKGHYIDGHTIRIGDQCVEILGITFRPDDSIDHWVSFPVKSVHAGKIKITKLLKENEKNPC